LPSHEFEKRFFAEKVTISCLFVYAAFGRKMVKFCASTGTLSEVRCHLSSPSTSRPQGQREKGKNEYAETSMESGRLCGGNRDGSNAVVGGGLD
jgi:hypothetical protein